MRQLASALAILAFALGVGGALGCRKPRPPAPAGHAMHEACALSPERCDRLCAGCDDRQDCLYRGGECLRRKGVVLYKKDKGDTGDDVFTGGCHYAYGDQACTRDEAFIDGDACVGPARLAEWTLTASHDSCLGLHDCDGDCKRVGRGAGSCVALPDYCGAGRSSAICKCEKGQPTRVAPPPANIER
jgi:hypothetical protein